MSARIEAERPRPLGLGSREPVRLAGRALKTVFTAFKTGTLSDRNKRDIKHRLRQAWPLRYPPSRASYNDYMGRGPPVVHITSKRRTK